MEVYYFPKRDILKSPASYILIPVNTEGVMGKGLALQFKQQFPAQFREYADMCHNEEIWVGHPGFSFLPPLEGRRRLAVYFQTKSEWRNPSKLKWVKDGLSDLAANMGHEVESQGNFAIAIPPLGCGNGGLKWADVHPLILDAFKDIDVSICIYGADKP